MIKIENVEVVGWEAAIRGMRNPMNSWDKSDTKWVDYKSDIDAFIDMDVDNCSIKVIGKNDLELMKKLVNAGTDHRKFMRMITVYVDITAPLYWIAEHDTYKVGTVRNSCSFMHKGISKPFEITDFSIQDKRVYDALSPSKQKEYFLTYPYETEEFRVYTCNNGRQYKIFKNGKIFRCEFSYTDNYGSGRTRTFEEKEVVPSKTNNGYFEVNIGGRSGEKWLLHRLVATVWKPDGKSETVNHIDGNKGNNSIENLELCERTENISKGFECGLYDNLSTLHCNYTKWRNNSILPLDKRYLFKIDCEKGLTFEELSEKYNITPSQANNIRYGIRNSETEELFCYCLQWEKIIDTLNSLRELYLDTKDINIFKDIRQLLPQGYNIKYTWQANYEVLANIYKSRKNHKLDEWREFCKWIETLPYSELITGKENNINEYDLKEENN